MQYYTAQEIAEFDMLAAEYEASQARDEKWQEAYNTAELLGELRAAGLLDD